MVTIPTFTSTTTFDLCKKLERSSLCLLDVTPFAIPTNDAQVTQLAFIRSEKKIISNHGAIMELYITGITLEVPESALEDDTVVLLGTLDPSAIPKVPTDVGEEVLSDIIIVGPAEARFNVPAILSIPHSLTEIPKHSSICIQQFGFGTNKWERLPLSSDLHKLDTNRGYITRPGLYALCLCLDAELHFIPRTSTLIRPFNEENGVAITFAENTFGNDETNVEFKLNTLTERMYEGFKSAGIKPSVILHINAANNDQPKKPVSIAMPIPKDVNQDENIRIFQCEHGDDFTDVTGKISFKIKEHCVILRVDHFTKYWIFGTSIEVPDFAPLLNFFYPIYDVCFSVYVKDESIRVGCCEWNARKVMHNEMTSFTYTKVDFIKGKLRNRDTSTIAMHGRYKISGNANGVQLIFNANEIEYTNSLYLEASESSKETPSSLKNEVIISIDMEGARDPVLLKFLKEDDSANQYPHQPLVTKNKRNLSSDKEDRDSIATTKDLLLLDLCEDYSFMLELESKLEDTSTNNIKDLLLILELSYEDRCKILESATSSLAFFENLSKSKPHLSLRELKASIEKVTSKAQPNMTIFMKIEKDIANGLVCFTLDTTLEGLSNSPKDWLYVLETIAGNLNPKEGTLLKSWRDIAGDHGYKSSEILGFQRRNKEESPIRKLFSLLSARTPSFTVCSLVEKLKQMRREDVAIMVEQWQDDTVKYRNNLREAKKLASEEE